LKRRKMEMNKIEKLTTGVLLFAATVLSFQCESTQPKTETPVEEANQEIEDTGENLALKGAAYVDEANNKLKKYYITGYRKNQTDMGNVPGWNSEIFPAVKQAIASLPEGYVLMVEGHADRSGNKRVNDRVSNDRAKNIYKKLIAEGVPASKLGYKGYADTRLMNQSDPYDGKNRRVTFQIVKK